MSSEQKSFELSFRDALGAFTTGITVVTTCDEEGKDIGLTANSFNSVSLNPPLVLWSLGKQAHSLPAFVNADHFVVHVLAENQQHLSDRFAKPAIDKFSQLEIDRGTDNIPVLRDCAAVFTCKTTYQYEGGDHIIFVGEVIGFSGSEKAPLLFHRGQYNRISDSDRDDYRDGDEPVSLKDDTIAYLLRTSYQSVMEPLLQEIESRDISFAEWSTLCLVARQGKSNTKQLFSAQKHDGGFYSEMALDDLLNKGIVIVDKDDIRLTASGLQLYLELFSFYKLGERKAIRELNSTAVKTLRKSLAIIAAESAAVG